MKPEVTKFGCYDCCVNSPNKKFIRKTVAEIKEEYSNWKEFKTIYECSLGLSDCRNLSSLSNSDFIASYVKALKERESVRGRRANC